jgi:hypothetical protein
MTAGELVGDRLEGTLASSYEHEVEAADSELTRQGFAYSRRCTCDKS